MDRNPHTRARKLLRDLLVQARNDAGLRQQDVADRLKKPQSFVSKYESGERRIDVAELHEICKALGIRASTLMARFEQSLGKSKVD